MDELDKVLSQLKDEYSPDAAAQQRVRVAIGTALVASTVVATLASGGQAAAASGAGSVGASSAGSVAGSTVASGTVAGSAVTSGSIASGSMLNASVASALGAGKGLLAASWGKAVLGVALVSGVTGLGITATELHWNPSEPSRGASAPAAAAVVQAPAAVSEQSGVSAQATAPQLPALQQLPTLQQPAAPQQSRVQSAAGEDSARRTRAPLRSAHVADAKVTERSTLLAELGLLQRASQAVRAGDAQQAKRALDEHAQRFRGSALAQEREGLSLLVRCNAAVSEQARTDAQRFVEQAPSSPLADSIRKQCLK